MQDNFTSELTVCSAALPMLSVASVIWCQSSGVSLCPSCLLARSTPSDLKGIISCKHAWLHQCSCCAGDIYFEDPISKYTNFTGQKCTDAA